MPNIEKLERKDNVKGLMKALKHKHSRIRSKAARALGYIGDPRAVEPLIQMLKDKVYIIRKDAVKALGDIGDPRATEPLIRALNDKLEGAAEALGKIGDQRASGALIIALNDENETDSFRRRAAVALEKIGNVFLEPLIRALNDGDHDVRELAIRTLGNMRDPRAVESLNRALNDDDTKIRQAAAMALKKIGESGVK